jgi:two-component system, cell cycle response regulator DivK
MLPVKRDLLEGWVVLVVEDEPDSLDVAQRILKHYEAEVHTAANGRDGLEIARHLRPRFIISDLSMPVMDGWELIHELKLGRDTMDIPVIALTAHAMIGDRERAIAAGFHNYLTKPLTVGNFMRDLMRVLTDIPQLSALLDKEKRV